MPEVEEKDEGHIIPEPELHAIINLLLIELDFLLDDKVASEIANEPESQKLLVKMNVLRKVLAVKDEGEMYRLLLDIFNKAKKGPGDLAIDDMEGGSASVHSDIVEDEKVVNRPEGNFTIDQYNPQEFDQEDRDREGFEEVHNQLTAELRPQSSRRKDGTRRRRAGV